MSLLLNMARRLSFTIAQPITIVGWYVSSFILMGLVAAATYDLPLPQGEDRALGQAYYYAIMAAALYFIIASLMVFTVFGAIKGHYAKEFQLSMSQRTLMLQTIFYMVYLLGGAAVFARIESWKFLDAVYWADFTLLTVGIGDYAPMTHLGRGLLFPYAILGIIILGLVIGSIRSLVLERGKNKLSARMLEKKRSRVVRRLTKGNGKIKLTPLSRGQHAPGSGKTERERREAEFNLMREIQQKAEQRRRYTDLVISGTTWMALWFIGAAIFEQAERNQSWTYFGSLYFAYTSLLTIGYGDYRLMSNSGKPFFVFWSLLAVPALTILISNMGDTVVKGLRDATIHLGEFTVLPGDASTKQRFEHIIAKATGGKIFAKGPIFEKPPGVLSEKTNDDEEKHDTAGGKPADFLADEEEEDELLEAKEARIRGDKLEEDIHYLHYLLVKEIRNVTKQLSQSPPKQYTYDEWAWFLRLMGEDEDASTSHRAPPAEGDPAEETKLQQGTTDDRNNDGAKWSWVGHRSPLMGEVEEAEWVLERLSAALEARLKEQNRIQRRREDGSSSEDAAPPSRESSKTLDVEQAEVAKDREKKGQGSKIE